jgi:SNF2 family DNA or RNA helicase
MPVTVELDEDATHILIDASVRYKELCKSIPGVAWHKSSNMWRMPLSWSGCLALRSTFNTDLEIGPKLGAWAGNELATRITPANELREALDFPEGDPDLFAHQKAGVQFLATARRALLADEPGLGKTAQAIRALAALVKKGENPFPALVVCPNSLKLNWEREFEKWWPGVRVQVIDGAAGVRRKQFDTYLNPKEGDPVPHVFVVNWETLRSHSRLAPYGSIALAKCVEHGGTDEKITATRCEVHIRELNEIPFKAVIADEIHRSKDPKSKQSRALWAATGDADIRIALTGTPIATDVLDLWSILHWLNPEEWPTKTRWADRMVDMMSNQFGGTVVLGVKPQMSNEFFAALNPRMRRMLKKVVLPNLPEVIVDKRLVEMSPKQKKAYVQMLDHMMAELDDGSFVMAPSPLTQMGRLLQFSAAYAEIQYDANTGEEKVVLSEPSATIDAVMDDILSGDFGPDSIAVSSVSRQLINLLHARLEKAKIPHGMITGEVDSYTRQMAVDDFQAGRTKYILFTAAAGGVGITLTAARRLIRLQRPWSLVEDKQVNDRVHRIGSEVHDSIIITDYVVEGTVQERVDEVLEAKQASAEEIVRDQDQLRKLVIEERGKYKK